MKKKATLYLIYVDGAKLDPDGYLKEVYTQKYGNDSRFYLFGMTTNKTLLDGFFIFHKKEYFIVKKQKIKHSDDEPIETKFDDYWLTNIAIDVGIWIDKKLQHKTIIMVLTQTEEYQIGYELEALDDFLYDFYSELEIHRDFAQHKVFEKDVAKSLQDLGFKKVISYVEHAYNDYIDRGMPVTSLQLNEWGALRITYGEVLIGGDRDEDSYI